MQKRASRWVSAVAKQEPDREGGLADPEKLLPLLSDELSPPLQSGFCIWQSLSSFENRLALFEKRARAFAHVFGNKQTGKELRFQSEAFC